LTGENGSGKTTLVEYLVQKMRTLRNQIIYIPQEISDERSQKIIEQTKNTPKEQKGFSMSIISRLGSDPNRLLCTTTPSPGEVRKLMLTDGILQNPILIIMDEPTNHMDLPSIHCVEDALSECSCALLLISHDNVFLKNLVKTFWNITANSTDNNEFLLKVL
jgi:ATPase subunit of ABC transporter with duplicated ATPase domains